MLMKTNLRQSSRNHVLMLDSLSSSIMLMTIEIRIVTMDQADEGESIEPTLVVPIIISKTNKHDIVFCIALLRYLPIMKRIEVHVSLAMHCVATSTNTHLLSPAHLDFDIDIDSRRKRYHTLRGGIISNASSFAGIRHIGA